MMARISRKLIPPARRPEDAPPPPAELYIEPENDIELLGEMLHDNRVMAEMLQELPFDRAHYRANIRIVLGAAVRMRERCARLLGEQPTAADIKGAIERLTDAIVDEIEREPEPDPGRALDLEASNIIDKPAEELPALVYFDRKKPYTDAAPAATEPHPGRKNGRPTPKTGRALTDVETRCLEELKKGPTSSHALATAIGGVHKRTYVALTELRQAGLVKHVRIDGENVNALAVSA